MLTTGQPTPSPVPTGRASASVLTSRRLRVVKSSSYPRLRLAVSSTTDDNSKIRMDSAFSGRVASSRRGGHCLLLCTVPGCYRIRPAQRRRYYGRRALAGLHHRPSVTSHHCQNSRQVSRRTMKSIRVHAVISPRWPTARALTYQRIPRPRRAISRNRCDARLAGPTVRTTHPQENRMD